MDIFRKFTSCFLLYLNTAAILTCANFSFLVISYLLFILKLSSFIAIFFYHHLLDHHFQHTVYTLDLHGISLRFLANSVALLMLLNNYPKPRQTEKDLRAQIQSECDDKYNTKVKVTLIRRTKYEKDELNLRAKQNAKDATTTENTMDLSNFTPYSFQTKEKRVEFFYPINTLRNIALKHVVTTHAVSIDIDYILCKNFRESFINAHADVTYPGDDHVAIVVPAFEFVETNVNNAVPPTKIDVVKLWKSKKIDVPDAKTYPSGHAATNSEQWMHLEVNKMQEKYYSIQYTYGMQPFLILRAPFPTYDERFVGYGQNRISNVYELNLMGYSFFVDPKLFLFHRPIQFTEGGLRTKEKTNEKKDWTVGWSCWKSYMDDLTVHYGSAMMSDIHEPCWVSEYVYPKLYNERGETCWNRQGHNW